LVFELPVVSSIRHLYTPCQPPLRKKFYTTILYYRN